MALTVKKKSKLTLQHAQERYRQLVETYARNGDEPDLGELQAVCFGMKKSVDDFHADATRLENRLEAVERLQATDAMRGEVDILRVQVGETAGKLDSLRAEFYDKELPLVQSLETAKSSLHALQTNYAAERDAAMQELRRTADPAIYKQIEDVRKERTKACELLERLPREIARAEQHVRRVELLRRQFDAWRSGKLIGLPVDSTGNAKLPLWHDDAGAWGVLDKPTPLIVRQCQERLERFIGACPTPAQIRERIAECRQEIAAYDAEVERLHGEMLRA